MPALQKARLPPDTHTSKLDIRYTKERKLRFLYRNVRHCLRGQIVCRQALSFRAASDGAPGILYSLLYRFHLRTDGTDADRFQAKIHSLLSFPLPYAGKRLHKAVKAHPVGAPGLPRDTLPGSNRRKSPELRRKRQPNVFVFILCPSG